MKAKQLYIKTDNEQLLKDSGVSDYFNNNDYDVVPLKENDALAPEGEIIDCTQYPGDFFLHKIKREFRNNNGQPLDPGVIQALDEDLLNRLEEKSQELYISIDEKDKDLFKTSGLEDYYKIRFGDKVNFVNDFDGLDQVDQKNKKNFKEGDFQKLLQNLKKLHDQGINSLGFEFFEAVRKGNKEEEQRLLEEKRQQLLQQRSTNNGTIVAVNDPQAQQQIAIRDNERRVALNLPGNYVPLKFQEVEVADSSNPSKKIKEYYFVDNNNNKCAQEKKEQGGFIYDNIKFSEKGPLEIKIPCSSWMENGVKKFSEDCDVLYFNGEGQLIAFEKGNNPDTQLDKKWLKERLSNDLGMQKPEEALAPKCRVSLLMNNSGAEMKLKNSPAELGMEPENIAGQIQNKIPFKDQKSPSAALNATGGAGGDKGRTALEAEILNLKEQLSQLQQNPTGDGTNNTKGASFQGEIKVLASTIAEVSTSNQDQDKDKKIKELEKAIEDLIRQYQPYIDKEREDEARRKREAEKLAAFEKLTFNQLIDQYLDLLTKTDSSPEDKEIYSKAIESKETALKGKYTSLNEERKTLEEEHQAKENKSKLTEKETELEEVASQLTYKWKERWELKPKPKLKEDKKYYDLAKEYLEKAESYMDSNSAVYKSTKLYDFTSFYNRQLKNNSNYEQSAGVLKTNIGLTIIFDVSKEPPLTPKDYENEYSLSKIKSLINSKGLEEAKKKIRKISGDKNEATKAFKEGILLGILNHIQADFGSMIIKPAPEYKDNENGERELTLKSKTLLVEYAKKMEGIKDILDSCSAILTKTNEGKLTFNDFSVDFKEKNNFSNDKEYSTKLKQKDGEINQAIAELKDAPLDQKESKSFEINAIFNFENNPLYQNPDFEMMLSDIVRSKTKEKTTSKSTSVNTKDVKLKSNKAVKLINDKSDIPIGQENIIYAVISDVGSGTVSVKEKDSEWLELHVDGLKAGYEGNSQQKIEDALNFHKFKEKLRENIENFIANKEGPKDIYDGIEIKNIKNDKKILDYILNKKTNDNKEKIYEIIDSIKDKIDWQESKDLVKSNFGDFITEKPEIAGFLINKGYVEIKDLKVNTGLLEQKFSQAKLIIDIKTLSKDQIEKIKEVKNDKDNSLLDLAITDEKIRATLVTSGIELKDFTIAKINNLKDDPKIQKIVKIIPESELADVLNGIETQTLSTVIKDTPEAKRGGLIEKLTDEKLGEFVTANEKQATDLLRKALDDNQDLARKLIKAGAIQFEFATPPTELDAKILDEVLSYQDYAKLYNFIPDGEKDDFIKKYNSVVVAGVILNTTEETQKKDLIAKLTDEKLADVINLVSPGSGYEIYSLIDEGKKGEFINKCDSGAVAGVILSATEETQKKDLVAKLTDEKLADVINLAPEGSYEIYSLITDAKKGEIINKCSSDAVARMILDTTEEFQKKDLVAKLTDEKLADVINLAPKGGDYEIYSLIIDDKKGKIINKCSSDAVARMILNTTEEGQKKDLIAKLTDEKLADVINHATAGGGYEIYSLIADDKKENFIKNAENGVVARIISDIPKENKDDDLFKKIGDEKLKTVLSESSVKDWGLDFIANIPKENLQNFVKDNQELATTLLGKAIDKGSIDSATKLVEAGADPDKVMDKVVSFLRNTPKSTDTAKVNEFIQTIHKKVVRNKEESTKAKAIDDFDLGVNRWPPEHIAKKIKDIYASSSSNYDMKHYATTGVNSKSKNGFHEI